MSLSTALCLSIIVTWSQANILPSAPLDVTLATTPLESGPPFNVVRMVKFSLVHASIYSCFFIPFVFRASSRLIPLDDESGLSPSAAGSPLSRRRPRRMKRVISTSNTPSAFCDTRRPPKNEAPQQITSAFKVVDFFFRLEAFLSTEEFAQLALQENEPRFDTQASRFPSYDREHSSDHVLVATAEFLMNIRTHQICLSCTDSDHVISARD